MKLNQLLVAGLAALTSSASLAQGAVKTWTGSGADNAWGTVANWDLGIPANSDSLLFSGATRLGNSNNITGLLLNGIGFNASGFNLVGLVLTNAGGIYDSAGNNTNVIILNLGAGQSITNLASGTTFVQTGNITNHGYNLTIGGDGATFLNGIVGGAAGASTNSGGVSQSGYGTLRLGAANTFVGGLSIEAGTVLMGVATGIPSGAGRGDVTIAGGGILNLNGVGATVNGLYGAGSVDNQAGTGTYTLTVGNNSTNSAGVFAGTIYNTSGNIGLTKLNTNTLTLGGYNTYSGPTLISGGTLALGASGAIANSPAITVSPGALFDISAPPTPFYLAPNQSLTAGRGTNGPVDILGSLYLAGGALRVYRSSAAGTVNVGGNLSLSGGTLSLDLSNTATPGGGVNDLVLLNGELNLSASTTVLLNPLTGTYSANPYLIISNLTSTVSGSAANLTASLPRGLSAAFDATTMPGSVYLTVSGTATPAALVWAGNHAAGGIWDVTTTPNWNGGSVMFYNLDSVTFNDLGNGNVTIDTGVSPNSTTINNSATNYIFSGSGAISGSGGLTKAGTGTVTFRNYNNFAGGTAINDGTLILDFLNSGTTFNQLFYNGITAGPLTLAGGLLQKNNRGNATTYQLFSATTIEPGASRVLQNTRLSGGSPAVYLGPLTRSAGGTLDVVPNTGSSGSQTANTVGIFTTTANNSTAANGILGGYATFNNSEWARVNTAAGQQGGTHIYGGASYTSVFAATTNTDMTANLTAAVNTNTSTVRFNTAGARTLTLNGDNVITTGGILVTTTVGANNSAITGGNSLTTGNGQDLIVIQNNATGPLTLSSVITNSGLTSIALTKSGAGTLILGSDNAYTGLTYLNAGTLQVGNGGGVGSIGSSSGVLNRGTLAFNRTDTVTFPVPISGSGALRNQGSGTVILTGNNTFAGPTTISAGTLQVGDGGTTGSLGSSPSITDNGSLIFNRSDDVTFAGPISGTGSLTKQGNGKLTLGGANTYQGSTTIGAGTLALGASASLTATPSITLIANASFDVSALGGITLNGALSQSISGSGSLIGSVAVPVGTSLNPGGSGANGTLVCANNLSVSEGTLYFDVQNVTNDLITVGGNLSLTDGTVQLNITGGALANGVYKLIGYTGLLSGSAGNLVVAGFSQPGQVVYLSDSTPKQINLVVSAGTAASLKWKGDNAANVWDVNTTPNWLNGAVPSLFQNNDIVTFDDTGSTTPAVSLVGLIGPGSVTVNATTDYTLAGIGKIRGGTGLTKANSGKLTVLAANSYVGATVVNGGTLQVGDGLTVGTLGVGAVTNNATLIFNEPGNQSINNTLQGPGTFAQQGPGVLALVGNNTFSGPLMIDAGILHVGLGGTLGTLGTGPVTDNTALCFNRAGTVASSGGISGSGSVSNLGVGTLLFGGNNTYAGNTVIANGTLKLAASQVIPDGVGVGNVVVDGGNAVAGTLDLNGADETINGLAGVTGTVLGLVVNNAGTATNILTVGEGDATSAFLGRILDNTGSGGRLGLTKVGAGTLTLQPGGVGSTYSGGTVISNGVISGGTSATANNNMLGAGSVTFHGGTLTMGGFTGSTSPDYGVLSNPFIVPADQTGTVNGTSRGTLASSLSGSGTFNYVARYVRGGVNGNWSAFTGTINVTSQSGTADDFRVNNAAGWPSAKLTLGPGVNMYNMIAGAIMPVGELSGVGSLVTAAG